MFHERLKQAMDVGGIRQTELSGSTDISPQNLSHLMAGRRSPSLDTLTKLLKALPHADARWLITGEKK
jgi:transcriptional regulator with XRE-family HTH domain